MSLTVTEEQIKKANLSTKEEKVVRSFYDLPLSKEDKAWAGSINGEKFASFFIPAMEKIRDTSRTEN